MTITDWTGAVGVTTLLVAFLLNLLGKIEKEGFAYLLLNVAGAGIACLASVQLRYLPFIILEGCWTLVSAVGLVAHVKSRR
ncbi:MAG TPA: hypothetical protein VKQ52_04550 [Puia sp.]|nr:hypothetical protein [Puia sp.]